MDFKVLEREALSLSIADRAKLAQELLESLDSLPESELESMWLDEAERRAQQLDQGTAQLIPGDVVSQKAHALLK
ncbi:MAG TPA: addiction module protein [Thermoanaerobaculia bacterium]|nr:addiction module protein [Thermoanaerobaculia bacterium]